MEHDESPLPAERMVRGDTRARLRPWVALALLVACGGPRERTAAEARGTPLPAGVDVLASGWYTLYQSRVTGESQLAGIDRGDPSRVVVRNLRPTAAGSLAETTYAFRVPFAVTAIERRIRDGFFVLGTTPSEAVIESWSLAYSPAATEPHPVGNGEAMRALDATARRTEWYRGRELGGIQILGADPEGRFLLVVHGDAVTRLSKMLPDGSRAVLHDSTTEFLREVVGLYPMQHASEGRLWILESPTTDSRMILRDGDNDTVFEGIELYSGDEWETLYAFGKGMWTDTFVGWR